MPVPRTTVKMERRLLRDGAYDAIRAAILDGTFSPGEVLDDGVLQEWLGTSRTPVRDALLILHHEGLVETRAQSSTRVASVVDGDVPLYREAFGGILASATRLTLQTASEEHRETLLALAALALAAAHRRDRAVHEESAERVYTHILALCPNAVLARVGRDALTLLTFNYRSAPASQDLDWEHLRLCWANFIDALRHRDDAAVERTLEALHQVPPARRHGRQH